VKNQIYYVEYKIRCEIPI